MQFLPADAAPATTFCNLVSYESNTKGKHLHGGVWVCISGVWLGSKYHVPTLRSEEFHRGHLVSF